MYKLPSIILRFGVIAGLVLSLAGVVIEQFLSISDIVTLGLMTIVLTPLVSLFVIGILMLLKKDIYGFILSQLAIAVILASIITSLYR
ncbi:MAG: hypothetical protein J7J20_05020 [Desulfurococcales archaeon]|nr:hypothetical protein [Desulfurococcales archaeon]